ncbi:DUF2290 domain-containing protein [Lactococcus lactis]|uniref:DUF2290 domain-containing protein n=1 Tax=Lactococcus lactis TaxID=1358 RepID=UPI003D16DADF
MVKEDMYSVIREDIEACIRDLLIKGLIINPKFSNKHCKQSQICSNNTSGIKKNISYIQHFLEEYSNNNYIFLLKDRSMIQINYEFITHGKSCRVSKVNLVFLPNPNGESEQLDELIEDVETDIEIIEELYSDMIENEYLNDFNYSSNYIRLDYTQDDSDFTEFLHARGHMHIGLNNNFRIPINRVPLLSEFIDLILYLNYTEDWKSFILDNRCVDVTIGDIKKKRKNQLISTIKKVLTTNEMENFHLIL